MNTCSVRTLKRGFPRWLSQDVIPKGVELAQFLALFAVASLLIGVLIEVLYVVGKPLTEATLPYSYYINPASPLASRVSEADFQALSWWFFDNRTREVSMLIIGAGFTVMAIVGFAMATVHRICVLGAQGDTA